MTNKPEISIIVPAYNAEKTINDTIVSILNQSYKNFELIVINDGSKDKTLDVCNKFQDQRIIIISQNNCGPAKTRNVGIEKAKGKYICFVDSDDIIDSRYLELLYNSITKNNTDLSICGIIQNNGNNNSYLVFDKEEKYENIFLSKDFMHLFEKGLLNSSCNKLYKTEIIKKFKIKFSNLKLGEDTNFNIDYFKCISNLSTIKEALYIYIQENSHLTKRVNEDMFVNSIMLHKKMIEIIPYQNHTYVNRFLYHQYLSLIIKYLLKISKKSIEKNNTLKILDKYICNEYVKKSLNDYIPINYKEYIIHKLIKSKLWVVLLLYFKVKAYKYN